MSLPSASIVVSSYNYERFLRIAIDSALAQTHPQTEVIVVDDGSRDSSPEIIRSYGSQVVPVIKANGGQGSAFNEGFARSTGDFVIFLDSDDYLKPDTVAKAAESFADPGVSKVHWNMWIGDVDGKTGSAVVRRELSEGDLLDVILHKGPDGYMWPPTSGNAWSRSFLQQALPIPVTEFNTCPDLYLATLAPLYGKVAAIHEPQGYWRYHPVNASFRDPFAENLADGLRRAERGLQTLETHARKLGHAVDPAELRRNSRWHQMQLAVEKIQEHVPAGTAFILLDEDHWKAGDQFYGRKRFFFPDHEGAYWGQPTDDAAAIAELERLRTQGAGFLVIPWPYGWWLEYYTGFAKYLREHCEAVEDNDRLQIFRLQH